MDSREIERDGVRLHGLWRPGEGVPIVIVPGVMADARAFVPVADAMGRTAPVLILDRRGRAPSGPLGEGYAVSTEVADLRAWLDELGTPADLVGWSYGATIAIEVAALDDRVRRVIGYEPVLGPFGADALPALRAADPDARVEIINRDVSGFSAEHVAALRAGPAWAQLRRLAEPLAAELVALNAFEPDTAWQRVPAALILGEQNRGHQPYGPAFDRVAARLPRSTTTLLPDQGHLAHVDDPVALGTMIGTLLDDQS